MKRIYAHNIIFGRRHYLNHVIELDEATGSISLFPFKEELHSTRFISGSVEVAVKDGELTASRPDIPVMRFTPYIKRVVWGGKRIAALKDADGLRAIPDIGESWEVSAIPGCESRVDGGPLDGLTIPSLLNRYGPALVGASEYARSGADFPLLVKILDAADDLSLQVHPSDDLARRSHGCRGKNEMWYVIDALPEAKAYSGFRRSMTPTAFSRAVADGTIMDRISAHSSHKGDVFFVPAGRIHCLGAGNLVLEVQDTSDISYRIHDFGRTDADGLPRPLHIEEAREAIDYIPASTGAITPERASEAIDHLVACPNFWVDRIKVAGNLSMDYTAIDSFIILTTTEGSADITDDRGHTITLPKGYTCMVPAIARSLSFTGNATLISTRRPI